MSKAEKKKFPTGSRIVSEGKQNNKVHLIIEGKVKILKNHNFITRLGEYQFIGEMSFLRWQNRLATSTSTSNLSQENNNLDLNVNSEMDHKINGSNEMVNNSDNKNDTIDKIVIENIFKNDGNIIDLSNRLPDLNFTNDPKTNTHSSLHPSESFSDGNYVIPLSSFVFCFLLFLIIHFLSKYLVFAFAFMFNAMFFFV